MDHPGMLAPRFCACHLWHEDTVTQFSTKHSREEEPFHMHFQISAKILLGFSPCVDPCSWFSRNSHCLTKISLFLLRSYVALALIWLQGKKKKKEKEILFVCQWYQDNILTELCVIDPTATVEETENMTLSCVIYHTSTLLILISVFIPPPCYCSSMWKTLVILPKVQVAGYS